VKQESLIVLNVFLITRVFASGYFIILVMNQSAVVFDFLDALEPLTIRYLPLNFQNRLYFLPTTFFKEMSNFGMLFTAFYGAINVGC
jgi:hypothetical protein